MRQAVRRPAVCRACHTPDQTAAYREQHCVILCAECNADWTHQAAVYAASGAHFDMPEVRCVRPEPRPYQPRRFAIVCGGGR